MKTFFNILQTLIGITTKNYPDEPFLLHENIDEYIYFGNKGHIISLMNSIFYKEKECNKINPFSRNAFAKFTSLNYIFENTFYKSELKEYIFNIFTQTQRHYYAFSRLARIYKLKKNPYVVTDDLMMNSLDPNDKLTFILIEQKSNFLFNINEIITIIETSIGNSPNFFSEPLRPLNPYNNQEFTLSTLYNIYFQMKQNQRVIPLLFHCFFIENFDKESFSEQHEPIIREYAINKYIFNSPHTVLYTSVISMLRHNLYTRKLTIHENFPKDLLVDIFRPFLFQDFIANYYIKGTSKVYNAKHILHIKLREFYEFNPAFGREIIKLTRKHNKIIKREYIFNTNHKSFYDITVSSTNQNNEFIFLTTNETPNIIINTTIFNVLENQEEYNDDDTLINDLHEENSPEDSVDEDNGEQYNEEQYDDDEYDYEDNDSIS